MSVASSATKGLEPSPLRFRALSPWRLLAITTAVIFLVEAATMALRPALGITSAVAMALFDATLLTVLVFPVLYWLSFRPLLHTLAERRRLAHKVVEVQEQERSAISRELHDEAGQALTSLLVGLRLLERDASSAEAVATRAGELRGIADGVMENLHRLAFNLRPVSLDHLGLVPALRQYLAEIDRQHSTVVEFEAVSLQSKRLTKTAETALFRIAQEAVTNALRHARSEHISVLLEGRDHDIALVVEDDGVGFDVDAACRSGRLGLAGIRERAEMLGGRLLIESTPRSGTTLVAEIPDDH